MKKNKMMRIASVLLVAVLISTCAISGTFAKYVTEGSAADTARVAKWGVQITTSSDIFDEAYDTTDTNTAGNIAQTVKVDTAGTNLVAPGTDKSITLSVTGKPEVAVKVEFIFNVTSDVVIPNGTEIADNNTLGADYTPVVFTLKQGNTQLAQGTLAEIEQYFEQESAVYAPNTDLGTELGTYTLSWAWAFNGNDVADTYLGNVAAGTVTNNAVKTDINFDFTIRVTQVD